MSKESDEYEMFTKRVMEELVGVTVHRQKVYTGRLSHRDIKIDVSFNYSVAGSDLLFLVECKCYNHAVPVDDVEEFHSKIDDIGAHKGIMVTTIGFQDGTIKTAKGRGIALALLTKKPQKGELRYVVNKIGTKQMPMLPSNENFWQGNFLGPLGCYDGGLRFEGMGQFLSMLAMDSMNAMKTS
jgi:hypothetical protein